ELRNLVLTAQAGHRVGRDGVDARERLTALRRQSRARRGKRVVTKDLARDRLALDVFGNEEGRAERAVVLAAGHHPWDRNARLGRGLEQEPLRHGLADASAAPGVAPEDQRLRAAVGAHGVERPRLAGRPTREPPEVLDARRAED